LIKAGLQFGQADGFENTEYTDAGDVGSEVGQLETDAHVGLRGEVVDLIGLHVLQHPHQAERLGQIAVVQLQTFSIGATVDEFEALA
jgi:hypothetical protein